MRNKKDDELQFEEELVAEVRADFLARQQARKNLERQWQLNMNFVMGNQYSAIDGMGEIEDYEKQYFWQEKEVFNHIAPIIDSRIAKLCKIRPVLNVAPASSSEQDIAMAKVSKKILKAVEHNLNLSEKITEATNWSELCGTSFYKIVWNSQKGNFVGVDENGNAIKNGEIDVSVCSPFEIFPNSNTTENLEDLSSIIQAKPYNVKQIEKIWGKKVEPDNVDVLTLSNASMAGGLGYTASVPKIIGERTKDSAVVIERYEAPSVEFPNGRVVVIAGNTLLAVGELPFVNLNEGKRGFPFVKQCALPQTASFWGISLIERLIPVQRSFNALKNRKHEYLNRIAMGILTVEDGSVDITNLEEEGLSPGKVLVYRQGATPPKILGNDSIPDTFDKEEEFLLNEFVQISGMNDLSINKKWFSSNMSGVTLELLLEQESDRLSATVDQIKFAVIEIGKMILRLYKQFATAKRLGKIEDDNGKVELFYWDNSEITSDDVVLDTSNEMGETLAQRRNLIFQMLNAGLFSDENGKMSVASKQKTLEMLGYGNWENNNDISELHTKRAGAENLQILNGEQPEVLPIDEHKLHIATHTAFALSNNYKKLTEGGRERLDMLLEHIEEHKRQLKISQE